MACWKTEKKHLNINLASCAYSEHLHPSIEERNQSSVKQKERKKTLKKHVFDVVVAEKTFGIVIFLLNEFKIKESKCPSNCRL